MAAPATASPFHLPAQVPALPAVVYPDARLHGPQADARRDNNGHFYFDIAVNGAVLHMMFDTGASRIVLRAEDAAKVGIDVGALKYTVISSTANGTAESAPVVLAALTVGTITRRNVAALVAKPGKLGISLLGQSFLSSLAGYKLEGEQLILRGGE